MASDALAPLLLLHISLPDFLNAREISAIFVSFRAIYYKQTVDVKPQGMTLAPRYHLNRANSPACQMQTAKTVCILHNCALFHNCTCLLCAFVFALALL